MPTRSARVAWDGGLLDGKGEVELTSSGAGTFSVDFPRRAAEDAGGVTSPEELVGAAHSACYAMSLSNLVGQAGGTPVSMDVRADVTLGPDPEGGHRLTRILLTVRAEVEGVDEQRFGELAQEAKAGCPISKALAGVPIEVDAALA